MWNRFPPQTSIKQLGDVLQAVWYSKIPLDANQNLYEFIPRRTAHIRKAKLVQHHINTDVCTVSVVFPLFYRITVSKHFNTNTLLNFAHKQYVSLYNI
jgi:hypothetical protein